MVKEIVLRGHTVVMKRIAYLIMVSVVLAAGCTGQGTAADLREAEAEIASLQKSVSEQQAVLVAVCEENDLLASPLPDSLSKLTQLGTERADQMSDHERNLLFGYATALAHMSEYFEKQSETLGCDDLRP